MVTRKLTPEEVKLTKKGIKKREKDLKELEQELQYFKEYNDFNVKWKEYLDRKKARQELAKEQLVIQTLKGLEEQVKSDKKIIETQKKQLTEGIEIKSPTGVN